MVLIDVWVILGHALRENGQNPVIPSEARNLSSISAKKEREIPRFARNDKINYSFRVVQGQAYRDFLFTFLPARDFPDLEAAAAAISRRRDTAQPSLFICFPRARPSASAGTSLVITEPAPM